MMHWIIAIFFPLTILAALDDYFDDLDHHAYLDEEENFYMSWTLINDTHMEIGLACINLGWCAMGISPNGQMPDSDINFFWIDDSDSTIYLQDRYATSRSVPDYDDEQNLHLLEGGQTSDTSWVRYIRPQFSCDDEDNVIETGTTRVLHAYQGDDPTEEMFDSSSVTIHSKKGSKSVNLLNGAGTVVDLEDDVLSYNITMDNYVVPDDDTTYYCKLFKLPETDEIQHIVKFEPIVQPGNEGIVHHMLLYYCPSSLVDEADIGTEEKCGTYANMAVESADCVYGTVSYSWAIGSEDFYMPENVGIEMSGTNDADGSELQYMLLEIHYDNPDESDAFVDSSGIRIWYTPSLRNETAGMIEFGVKIDFFQFIPQAMPAAVNTALCASDCTEAGLPSEGVQVFASMLHAHTNGIALQLRHVRDGVELEPIDTNWNYDFDYQNLVSVSDGIEILPGDDLILDCYYNTSDQDDTVFAGESTNEEMCFVFLYVYPKPELRECQSRFLGNEFSIWYTQAQNLGFLDDDFNYNTNIDGAKEFYQALWWNTTYRYQTCDDQYGGDLISPQTVQVPEITDEYQMEICGQTLGIDVTDYWYPNYGPGSTESGDSDTSISSTEEDGDAGFSITPNWLMLAVVFVVFLNV